MGIIKVVKKSGKTHKALKSVLDYVGTKGEQSFGINCSDDYKEVYKEFMETKKNFKKPNGRQYRHYIQSFNPGEVDNEKALAIGVEWAKKSFEGHEILIVTHTDKEHIHNHVIVNSVNFDNGHKLHETNKDLEKRKELNDQISLKHGLDKNQYEKKNGQVITYDKDKYQIIRRGADITQLAKSVVNVSMESKSPNDFADKLKKLGYYTEWDQYKKHITFTVDEKILKGKKNKFRLSNLKKTFNIELFEKEKLLEQFGKNRESKFTQLVQTFEDNLTKKQEVFQNTTKTKKNIKIKNNEIEL